MGSVFIEEGHGTSGPKAYLYIKENGYLVREIYPAIILARLKKGDIVLLTKRHGTIHIFPSPKGNCLQNN